MHFLRFYSDKVLHMFGIGKLFIFRRLAYSKHVGDVIRMELKKVHLVGFITQLITMQVNIISNKKPCLRRDSNSGFPAHSHE